MSHDLDKILDSSENKATAEKAKKGNRLDPDYLMDISY